MGKLPDKLAGIGDTHYAASSNLPINSRSIGPLLHGFYFLDSKRTTQKTS